VQILKPFRFDKIIVIKCLDEKENQLAGATLTVTNADGVTDTYTSDAEGMIALDASGVRKLNIISSKSDYTSAQKNFETELVLDGAIIKMIMPKIMGFYLEGNISDGTSSAPLSDVKIEITNAFTKEKKSLSTDEKGLFKEILANAKMDDKVTYSIKLSKDGYLSKSLSYSAQLDHEGKYDLNSSLDLSLEKIALGQDLAKVIDISPIYFDLGKFAIRPDAGKELDKIIEVMNSNPNMEIELGSHTDCRGTAADNLKLSDKRAKASAEYIKKKISRPERIKGKGYGESQLVNSCECEGKNVAPCSEEQHQANRRTEFKIQKL
jgi:outer membrane protein OmpA-like peptidoglycan-associated protein